MTDRARAFNWNGGASLSAVPGYSTSAPAAGTTFIIPGHWLLGFHLVNLVSVPLWAQIFDGTSQPASAAVPLSTWPIASAGVSGTLDVVFPGDGRYFGSGAIVTFSSLASVLETPSLGSTGLLDAQYL